MRQFSDIEKQIIETICKGHKQMANLVCLFLDNETVQISKANNTNPLTLYIDNKKYKEEKFTDRAFQITEKIVIIIHLLKYLEENSLITYYIPSHGRAFVGNYTKTMDFYTYYQNHQDEFTGWWFTDEKTQKYLIAYTDHVIHPTEDLRTHVQNKYKTKDEQRHSQTLIATWFAIGVSLFLGVYGVYQNNSIKTQEIKINEKQKTEIINALINESDNISPLTTRKSNAVDSVIVRAGKCALKCK